MEKIEKMDKEAKMTMTEITRRLFQTVDNLDTDAFLSFLTDDVTFRFGNAEPVSGRVEVGNVLSGFFGSISALRHDVTDVWEQPGTVICHGNVTYTRQDKSTLTVPFANILKMNGDLIKDYLIFIDISELYNPA